MSKISKNVSRDLPDNSQRDWHGTVYDNVNVFGLGGIDLLRQSKYRDLLLPIHPQHAAVSM